MWAEGSAREYWGWKEKEKNVDLELNIEARLQMMRESLKRSIDASLTRMSEKILGEIRELGERLDRQEEEVGRMRRIQENEIEELHTGMSKAMEVIYKSVQKVGARLEEVKTVLKERLPGYPDLEFAEFFREDGAGQDKEQAAHGRQKTETGPGSESQIQEERENQGGGEAGEGGGEAMRKGIGKGGTGRKGKTRTYQ
ncbi:hypothetical protein BDZ91DRAFT_768210 [Kalaharituber pfeilii]|nr:hypothetical protein BDZ91DRAFT_768210 [Kalaharituber pfeilii]